MTARPLRGDQRYGDVWSAEAVHISVLQDVPLTQAFKEMRKTVAGLTAGRKARGGDKSYDKFVKRIFISSCEMQCEYWEPDAGCSDRHDPGSNFR